MKATGKGRGPSLLHGGTILVLLLIVVWRLLLPALRQENFGIVSDADGDLRIQDFAGNLAFAKAFWAGKASYDLESHLRLTSEWVGRPVQRAMPFNYSPTMLWVLGPLCVLPTVWAYIFWTMLSAAAVWWVTRPGWSVWLLAVLFSPIGVVCFGLGQTSFLTTAAMLFLIVRDLGSEFQQHPVRRGTSDWADAVVLWALTAKPPVAVTSGVVFLARRRWRCIGLAVALGLLSTAVLLPRLGIHGLREYVQLMTHSDVETGDPAFTWSLAPETMGNVRALLLVTFGVGDAAASRWSSALWGVSLIGIVAAGLRRRLPVKALWAFAVLAYLLFCPHVSSTGELHLALVLALVSHENQPMADVVRWVALGLVLVVVYLPPEIGPYRGVLRLPLIVAAKVLLGCLVATRLLHSR